MAPKINPKMKNPNCVADAFLDRFGVFPGRPNGATILLDWAILATIFDKKSEKWHPTKTSENRCRTIFEVDAKKASKVCQNGCQHQ